MKTRVEVYISHAEPRVQANWIRQIGERVVSEEGGRKGGVLSIVIVDDRTIQTLNRRFLGRDRPTDVIAFPLDGDDDDEWGEVYVSADRADDQAGAYGVSYEEEVARLVIHGVLHLLGYDDGDDDSRERMSGREDRYLSMIGFHRDA